MERLLRTSGRAAAIYAVLAAVVVVVTRPWGETLWVPVVYYVGPVAHFIALWVINRAGFLGIRHETLASLACGAACLVMTAISLFLVVVVAVNIHLMLGGRL